MKLLTILILSSNRYDLLGATINSLLNTITYPYWEMIIYNHDESIGKGWNQLRQRINGEYVLWCQDDWYFIEKWDWIEKAIEILDNNKEVGIVRLRKESDGQNHEKEIKKIKNGYLVNCIGGGFTMNPFIAKKEIMIRLGVVDERKIHGKAELSIRERYKGKHETAKLDNPARGICIHIGRGRRIKT